MIGSYYEKIQEADLENKKVLLRVDLNVAIENSKVKETFKIKAIQKLAVSSGKKCKVALISHLGRPEGRVNSEFSLEQIKTDLENILGVKIIFINDCLYEEKR